MPIRVWHTNTWSNFPLAFCSKHATLRRQWEKVTSRFFEAKSIAKEPGAAQQALEQIRLLYAVEQALRVQPELSEAEFVQQLKIQAQPILEQFYQWLQEQSSQVPPKTALGKAVTYALAEWPKLIRYLDSQELTPDNNACEQAIRPFVVGRKNWLFAQTSSEAYASAALTASSRRRKPTVWSRICT